MRLSTKAVFKKVLEKTPSHIYINFLQPTFLNVLISIFDMINITLTLSPEQEYTRLKYGKGICLYLIYKKETRSITEENKTGTLQSFKFH